MTDALSRVDLGCIYSPREARTYFAFKALSTAKLKERLA
jgi:hypothetical protein